MLTPDVGTWQRHAPTGMVYSDRKCLSPARMICSMDLLNVIVSLKFPAETSEAIGLIPGLVDADTLYDDSLVNAL